ncbi:MAG: transcription-repair coupling factor [Candidatus Binatus sp.]|uniref:transcription-repair coupling factor n=1 Tax=Candidatus Binatus sp. TaxID=2811406 RepID=UPI00271F2719|nr:transcription-repair coupling factor [Candidatus Binatus sp.]MDO8433527.1 transcription-repair coupling factor [Candidatus Binatus sp.]
MPRSLKEAAGELEARLAANRERRFPVMGLRGASNALMLREMALRLRRPVVVIASLQSEAEALAAEVGFFLDEPQTADSATRRVHLMRSWEVKPMAQLSPPPDAQASQLGALYALLRQTAPLVVTSAEALMTRTIPRAIFNESIIKLAIGDRLDFEILIDALASCGYQRVPQTEEPGDFSVRGGIVDAYSPLYNDPIRIELEDDVVISIRHFEAASQRSAEELTEATIIRTRYVPPSALKNPKLADAVALRAAEIGMIRKEAAELAETLENGLLFPGAELLMPYVYGRALDSIFDYMPKTALLWMIDPGRILAEANRFSDTITRETTAAIQKPAFHPAVESLFLSIDVFEGALGKFTAVEVGSLVTMTAPREGWAAPVEIKTQPSLKLGANNLSGARTPPSFEPLAIELKNIQRGQGRALMVVEGPNQVARLKRHLEAWEVDVNTECKTFGALLEWPDYRPAIIEGEISAGVVMQADGLYIYSEEEIFGEPRVRRRRRETGKGALLNLQELKPDDHVVHIDHGIAKYRGLKHLKVAEVEGDFLHLEYAGNDTMYVPVERINLVQRYIGGDDGEPKLDKLGSGSWEKVKRRTRQAVLAMAAELLDIYAAREVLEGHAYPQPGGDYADFAERFEFEETPDQQAAIDDVIRDLTRAKPMDRLICGDAGFGKTEVALRAAFIAAMDGRQIAVLVPTTILAEQHWNTFRERFKDYPVRVEMVSRFRSQKENRATIEEVARGKVDIVVGTHRLLSSDVQFPRLGLLVIDEEHRFGVADKERIKKLKKLVPVLTMTATPIPRTLHMAMLGIRDLSVIQTAPPDRQLIRTFVAHFDDDTIRDAMLRELNRGGQVFFVHNRVENIDYMAGHLRALVPEAKLAIAHGQMNERQLENVMRDFIEKRINVLVCSAIIESGLDIPNANTMIINRADHFGLAQLYQLRGRVGRSRQKAYAYLLIPGEHIITRDAKRRIDALRELVESESGGGGFKLALADLEHRGAGNLLGSEQSGEIVAVGFELYTEMMEEAIAELRGEPHRPDFEPELKISVPAYIPAAYVSDENERLVLYRRLARAQNEEDLEELRDEMRDRFGPVPTLIENLIAAMNVRRQMKQLMILSAILKGAQLEVRFHPDAPVETARLVKLADQNRGTMRLTPSYQVIVRIEPGEYEQIFAQLNGILQALAGCEKLDNWPAMKAGQVLN